MRPTLIGSILVCLALLAAPVAAATNVPAGTISLDTTWTLAGSPYTVLGTVTVQGTDGADGVTTLTIEPGVVVNVNDAHDLQIGVAQPGALIADGDAAGGPATIVFTSSNAAPTAPLWDGILFGANARASVIRNAEIAYSGRGLSFKGAIRTQSPVGNTITLDDVTIRTSGDANGSALFIAGGTVAVTDCTFTANASYDVRLSAGTGFVDGSSFESVRFDTVTPTVTFTGNTVTNWGTRLSRLSPNAAARFALDNTVSAIPLAKTEVAAGTQSVDGTWRPTLGSYQVLGSLTIQGTDGADAITTLTVEGSTQVLLADFSLFTVGNTLPGAIVIDGDAGATPGTVLLTSSQAAPVGATWAGIWLRAQSAASTLRNVVMRHAGRGGGVRGAIYLSPPAGTPITIDRLTVSDNGNAGTAGMYVEAGSATVTSSAFSNNAYFDLQLAGGSGSFTGTSFSSVRFESSAALVTFTGCTVANWGARTSRLSADAAARFAPDNTVSAVAGAITEILNTNITVDGTFSPALGIYRPLTDLNVAGTDGADGVSTLTLLPGTRLEFGFGYGLNIGTQPSTPGGLVTLPGSPVPVIAASSLAAGEAYWDGVLVNTIGSTSIDGLRVERGNTCFNARGALALLRDLETSRCTVGLAVSATSLPAAIERVTCNTVDVCVRTTNVSPVFRQSDLVGKDFGLQNSSPTMTTVDARDNWWGASNGPSGAGAGSGSAVSAGVLFDPWLAAPLDDGDGAPLDDGDGVADPCTAGATSACDDNCPGVSNASQADGDGDGVGDACEEIPVITVSSDPADAADFARVQDGIDAAPVSGTRVVIYPGFGAYAEQVRLDRPISIVLEGVVSDPPVPVVIDGGSGAAVFPLEGDGLPHRLESLTLRGNNGLFARYDANLTNVVFDANTGVAADLDEGDFRIVDSRFQDGASNAISLRSGTSAVVERTLIDDMAGNAIFVQTQLTLIDTVIAGASRGILMSGAGSKATVLFSTIVDSTAYGIDNTPNATVTVADSIVYGNASGDFINVPCSAVSRSNTGLATGCAGANGNIAADPLLDASYRLQTGSPCIDMGLDTTSFGGYPAKDIDRQARLADGNGDNVPLTDCGADEWVDPAPAIAEVTNLRFVDDVQLTWDAVEGAVLYHLYGGDIATLSPTSFGTCQDALDPNLADTSATILALPPQGSGTFTLVTAENALGDESILGYGSSSERPFGTACP